MQSTESYSRPQLRRKGWLRETVSTVIFVVAMVSLVNLATARAVVDGPSMEPTLFTNQYLLISRLHYLFGDIQRGEIAVFFPPNEEQRLIKRVIGIPGDTVEIRNQLVYVNGQQIAEPYFVNAPCTPSKCPDQVFELGTDEYFLMGDNRNRSRDSRVFDAVPKENIIGRAVLRYIRPYRTTLFGRAVELPIPTFELL